MYDAMDAENLLKRCKAEGVSKADTIRLLAELCLGWPYVYAAAGEMCTPSWRRNRMGYSNEKYAAAIKDNCPVLSEKQSSCSGCKWDGCRCFDCRGFTRWLLAQAGVPLYGETVTTQWETASNWAAKGNIDTLPHSLVCNVFRPGHTGMYMGDETVIHCSGTVKREALPGNPKWERWAIPAGLYTNDELRKAGVIVSEEKNIPTLRKGARGDNVEELQALLNAKYGFSLDVDGVFGDKTVQAVKAFQSAHGLKADGIVGPKTWKALGITPGADDKNHNQPLDDGNNTVDRARYIWDKLYTAIRNPYGVAGLMGNLQAESGMNPENLQNTGERALGMSDAEYTAAVDSGAYTAEQFTDDGFGYGLAQWTYRTRKAALLRFAKEQDKSIGNLDMQLDFLMDELLGSYSSVWYVLLNATTVREASDAVLLKYERPKNTTEENQQKRAELGQKFYDEYAKISPSEPPIDKSEETITEDVKASLKAVYANLMMACNILHKMIEGE